MSFPEELDPALQVWSYLHRVERKEHSQPDALPPETQDAACILCARVHSVWHIQRQDRQVVFSKAAFQQVSPQYPLGHEVILPQGQDLCSSLCETLLDSCWPISPPCQGPPQSFTSPGFQLFAQLFLSSYKLLMKMLNTGSCTNFWSILLVIGSWASHCNSLCWSWSFDPSSSVISFQFIMENVMGVCSESLAKLRINNIHYCPLISKPLISFKRILG